MKLLVLIAIILPLAAQNGSAPADPMVLTTQEHETLSIAFMQAQGARINLLEHLAAKQGSNDDMEQAQKAAQQFTALLDSLVKKHGACDGGQWNFASKTWLCPEKKEK